MKKYISKSLCVLCGVIMAVSCTGSFDDVNTDPDNPLAEDVPSTNILAYCERYASDNMFDEWFDLNESCGFSGQVAKLMYTEESYYNFRRSVNTSSWTVCDRVTGNLKDILDKEDATSNMWAVATIFQCQIWQVKSDRWGNIPYYTTSEGTSLKNEALQLEDGITTPAYDKQQNIYPDLLDRLARAVAVLESGEATDEIGDGDVMLGGDIEAWIKYGNALRLRIAARIANVDPLLAKSTFEDVVNDGNMPQDNDDNVFFEWNAEYPEPWADYFLSRPNEYGISDMLVNTLKEYADPRIDVYATPTRSYSNAVSAYKDSIKQGYNPIAVDEDLQYAGYPIGTKAYAVAKNYSQIGTRFQNHTGVTGFSPWLRSCEVYFALAYAASKGWDVGMTVQEAYEKGVTLSLEENDIDEAVISAYLASDKVKEATEDNIMLQWWISLFKNGQEAWSVYRMASTDTYLFKNNKIAVDSYYPNHNCPPMCYGYPDTERDLNSDNCAVESAAESDYFWGKQMWWDVREGLK